MIRTILYATDLGLYAPYVLQHAVSLAQAYKAELYVVHAVEPMGLFAESVLQSYLTADALQDKRKACETSSAQIKAGTWTNGQ